MSENSKPSEYIGGILFILLWPIGTALAFWGLEIILKQFSFVEGMLTLLVILALYIIHKNR